MLSDVEYHNLICGKGVSGRVIRRIAASKLWNTDDLALEYEPESDTYFLPFDKSALTAYKAELAKAAEIYETNVANLRAKFLLRYARLLETGLGDGLWELEYEAPNATIAEKAVTLALRLAHDFVSAETMYRQTREFIVGKYPAQFAVLANRRSYVLRRHQQ